MDTVEHANRRYKGGRVPFEAPLLFGGRRFALFQHIDIVTLTVSILVLMNILIKNIFVISRPDDDTLVLKYIVNFKCPVKPSRVQ